MNNPIEIGDAGASQIIGTLSGLAYATTESFTQEYWLDGAPIYRKVYQKTWSSATLGTAFEETLDSSGVFSQLVKVEVVFNSADGWETTGPLRYASADPTDLGYIVQPMVSDSNLLVWVNILLADYKTGTYTITAYYTHV
jgi:hypothetical protein